MKNDFITALVDSKLNGKDLNKKFVQEPKTTCQNCLLYFRCLKTGTFYPHPIIANIILFSALGLKSLSVMEAILLFSIVHTAASN